MKKIELFVLVSAITMVLGASIGVASENQSNEAFVSARKAARQTVLAQVKANLPAMLHAEHFVPSGAINRNPPTVLIKLNRLKLTLSKDLILHRRVIKHSAYGPIVDKVAFAAIFQNGHEILEQQIQPGTALCIFQKEPAFLGENEFQYKEFSDKHPNQTENFKNFIFDDHLSAYGDRDNLEQLAGLNYESKVVLQPYFPKNPADDYEFIAALTCAKNGPPVTADDVSQVTGGIFEVGQVPFPKGNLTEGQLQQKWNDTENLFRNAHTPAEAELRVGQGWTCDSVSLGRMAEEAPVEFSYEKYPSSKLLEKYEARPGTYTNGFMLFLPYKEGLIGKMDGIVVTYRVKDGAIIQEIAETGKNRFLGEERDSDYPNSSVASGLKATGYARCTSAQ